MLCLFSCILLREEQSYDIMRANKASDAFSARLRPIRHACCQRKADFPAAKHEKYRGRYFLAIVAILMTLFALFYEHRL